MKLQEQKKFPPWLKKRVVVDRTLTAVRQNIADNHLHTVCYSANCPNIWECFTAGNATFLILGDQCTRTCRFCAVSKKHPTPVDPDEPRRVAEMVKKLRLAYVVITSVTRDDLDDGGSGHFAAVVAAIRATAPSTKIELLIPDFKGEEKSLKTVVSALPDVLGHNIETVSRYYPSMRPQASYDRSLRLLQCAKEFNARLITKSSLMVGLGETPEEVRQSFDDLRASQVDIVTIGQYLKSDRRNQDVAEFIPEAQFDVYKHDARERGFGGVMSGPFVRSSYRAYEVFQAAMKGRG